LIDNYKKFIGKPCTILTQACAFPIKDSVQGNQFFTGIVKSVDQWGVWVKHPTTPCMSYFQFPLVGIVEEPFVAEGSPEYRKIKEEIEAKKKPTPAPVSGSFTSVSDLTQKIKNLQTSNSAGK
jgi:hypothetical protein